MPPDAALRDLAVIVVNYGSAELLSSLKEIGRDLAPARIIIVDNYSTPEVRHLVKDLCASEERWTGVFPDTNTGFGTGNNLGAVSAVDAHASYLLFLNPDASIDRASVLRLVAAVQHDHLLLAAPTIRTSSGRIWSSGTDLDLDRGSMSSWRRRTRQTSVATLPWVSGACFLVHVDLWHRVEGFDNDYFLYWEDVDLCARVRAVGGTVRVEDHAHAIHDEGQTHQDHLKGKLGKSATYYHYNIRNREMFAKKWLSPSQQRRWRRSSVRAAYDVLMRGGRRQFLHPYRPLRAACSGWVAGLRDSPTITGDVARFQQLE